MPTQPPSYLLWTHKTGRSPASASAPGGRHGLAAGPEAYDHRPRVGRAERGRDSRPAGRPGSNREDHAPVVLHLPECKTCAHRSRLGVSVDGWNEVSRRTPRSGKDRCAGVYPRARRWPTSARRAPEALVLPAVSATAAGWHRDRCSLCLQPGPLCGGLIGQQPAGQVGGRLGPAEVVALRDVAIRDPGAACRWPGPPPPRPPPPYPARAPWPPPSARSPHPSDRRCPCPARTICRSSPRPPAAP